MTKKKESPKKAGRKSKFNEEFYIQAEKLAKLGATDKEIADFFNISEVTLNSWKKKYPLFLKSLKKGKILADADVAHKLYQRAIGYDCKDTKFATFEGQITDSQEYIRHYPPDPTAMIFWLKNRQPSKWRERNIDFNDESSESPIKDLFESLKRDKK